MTLRIPLPRKVTETGRVSGESRSLAGTVVLQVPAAWARLPHPTLGRIAAELAVSLSPGCKAKIELITGGDTFTKSPAAEIQEAIFFVFSSNGAGPPRPLPVPVIAKHVSAYRLWELVGPPPGQGRSVLPDEPPPRELKPLYGVEVQRIAAPNTWASVTVSVWTPVACLAHLPRRAYLQSALEGMLASARFDARVGPPRKH